MPIFCTGFGLILGVGGRIIFASPGNRVCETAFGQQAPAEGDFKLAGVLDKKAMNPFHGLFCFREQLI